MRILFLKEDDIWTAQAIDVDICVHGKRPADLLRKIELAIKLEVKSNSLDDIGPAPRLYEAMWNAAAELKYKDSEHDLRVHNIKAYLERTNDK